MSREISQKEYKELFGLGSVTVLPNDELRTQALKDALHIREMEIKLYWTRTTYFSAFIGLIFAGYGYVVLEHGEGNKGLAPLICLAGFIFSIAWFLVNKGSKYWQENWENHVDMLEYAPLYKTTLARPKPSTCCEAVGRMLFGPSPFSVSRINQSLSIFVTLIWFYLLSKEEGLTKLFAHFPGINVLRSYGCVAVAVIFVCVLFLGGRSHRTPHPPSVAKLRKRKIKKP